MSLALVFPDLSGKNSNQKAILSRKERETASHPFPMFRAFETFFLVTYEVY